MRSIKALSTPVRANRSRTSAGMAAVSLCAALAADTRRRAPPT